MCGIIGYTGHQSVQPLLIDGLRTLEYRGYDSSGISILSRGKLKTWKAAGKLDSLVGQLPAKPSSGSTGIGHTRWATHGAPTDENAHPHTNNDGAIAVVHNGIIENADALKQSLAPHNIAFASDTDTEVLAHLIALAPGNTLTERVRHTLLKVNGTYGLAVVDANEPGVVVVARNGSPVIIGHGDNEMFVASDMSALARHTREVSHLEDGEMAKLTTKGCEISAIDDRLLHRTGQRSTIIPEEISQQYDRGGYEHYLYREITDQSETVRRTLGGRIDRRFNTAHLGGLNLDARELINLGRIRILGCGSAYYAGGAGADMIESLARIPCSAEPAAEFRYRNPVIERDTLYIVVSQSGETFDTLAATREIKRKGGRVLGIVNGVGSTIAREVDGGIYMHAGPEMSVASTKAYTSMLTCFALLALHLARIRDLSPQRGGALIDALDALPDLIEGALATEEKVITIAEQYHRVNSLFFIGRASACATAHEGAQKLKEISYIHAESYPASELKHGPLALISPETPTVVILPDDDLFEKSFASLAEIKARQGPAIVVTQSTDDRLNTTADAVINVPASDPLLHPIIMGIPLQLFAYHCARLLKRDIDQPRNLAKSVTVE